jgi:hypothetical protein
MEWFGIDTNFYIDYGLTYVITSKNSNGVIIVPDAMKTC